MKYFTKNVFAFLLAMTFVGMTSSLMAQMTLFSYEFSSDADYQTDWVTGGTNAGPEDWVWTDDPSSPTFGSQPDFASATVANGFIQFNSDSNGPNAHDVTVTTASPFSTAGQSDIFLEFQTQYAFFYGNDAQVGVSTNGTDFTYYTVLADVEQNDLTVANQVVILELPEAENQAEVWIQFRWIGQFEYVWKIDDVVVTSGDPTPDFAYSLGDSLFYSPSSYAQPVDHVDVDSLFFFADVFNDGLMTINNVAVTATVEAEDGTVLFEETQTIPSLASGERGVVEMDNGFSQDGLELGAYTINYTVEADEEDDNLADNTNTETFVITTDLFSKEEQPLFVTGFADPTDYTLANIYYISPNITPNTLAFTDVTFTAQVSAANEPLAGKEATVVIAKVKDDVVDAGWNGFDNNGEITNNEGLEVVAFAPYMFETEDAAHVVPVTDFDGNPVVIEPGARYFVAVALEGASNVVNHSYSDEIDYLFAYRATTLYDGTQWFNAGFGSDNIAVIRAGQGLVSSTDDTPLPAEALNVFPNPTNEQISLEVDLENTGKANIIFADMTGRVLGINEYDNLNNGTYSFDVSNYPNGVYMARLVTGDGSRTVKFTVQH